MGRHAASKDSTVSPPRSNPRALRDFHDTLISPLDTARLSDDPQIDAPQIDAADLIARFRASGLLSDVSRRGVRPTVAAPVNAPAPLPLLKRPVIDKAVAPKAAAARPWPAAGSTENVELDPSAPVRVVDLRNRHADLTSPAPRTANQASVRTPAPSIGVALRPVLTVAAIITAFSLVEGPNLLSTSHVSAESRTGGSIGTTSVGATGTDPPANDVTIPTTSADLPAAWRPRHHRHGVGPGLPLNPPGRRRRSSSRPRAEAGADVAGHLDPTEQRPVHYCFCLRWGSLHPGIDLASKLGTPLLAVGDGTVLKAGPAGGFGNWVVIQHSNGDVSVYGHMRFFFVHAGQKVKAGEKIAIVGDQGFSTGPHLHFEVHKGGLGGTKINPIPWLKARGIVIGPLSKVG